MRCLISIKRLFSSYDKQNHSNQYIIAKTILLFIGLSICARIFMGLCYSLLPSEMTNIVSTNAETSTITGIKQFSLKAWVLVIIIGPFMEETAFRLWLSMKKKHIAISLSFFLYYILGYMFKNTFQNQMITAMTCALLSLIVAVMFYYIVSEKILLYIKHNYTIYPFLVLCGCIIFSLSHLTNYVISSNVLLFGLISCLPQLMGAISMSYLRINLGFIYGLIFHCLINLVSCYMSTL